MKARKRGLSWILLLLAAWTLWGISAEASQDELYVAVGPRNEFLAGGGSGYDDGQWYYYPASGWWSQWFAAEAFDPGRKRVIEVRLSVQPLDTSLPCRVKIAYNWSTSHWSSTGTDRPALPADGAEWLYIKRHEFFEGYLPGTVEPIVVQNRYEISDCNPQWVSIDVRGENFVIVDASVKHEPAAKGLGGVTPLQQESQACCFVNGECSDMPPELCKAQGGVPQGIGTKCLGDQNQNGIDDACEQQPTTCEPAPGGQSCLDVTCPNAGDACLPTKIRVHYRPGASPSYTILSCACLSPNACHVAIQPPDSIYCVGGCPAGQKCELNATDNGDGTIDYECDCVEEPQPTQACCFADGSCADLSEQDCLGQGGTPQGANTACLGDQNNNGTDDACEQPAPGTIACCFPDGSCTYLEVMECLAGGGKALLEGMPCEPPQACCLRDGSCIMTGPSCCRVMRGEAQGPGTTCENTVCPQPPQACCFDDGTCQNVTPAQCVEQGGSPQGSGTDCSTVDCLPAGQCDWNVGDPHKIHWAQTPDLNPTGVDVDMFWTPLADDFKCAGTGPIKDIHLWGSFADDILPKNGPGSLTFQLSIYSNIPAGEVQPWSMPGELLWTGLFGPGQYAVRKVHDGPEDWYDPTTPTYLPANHRQAYQYNFCIEDDPPGQEEGKIYWLQVKDLPPEQPDYTFGWKSTRRELRWNDDAVWWRESAVAAPGWVPLTYPDGHEYAGETLDLAFVITGGEEIRPEHDLGDAPDSSNSWLGSPSMTAYPGVQAKYPTVYGTGSPPIGPIHWQPKAIAFLGEDVTLENEADIGPDEDPANNIDPPNDSPNQDQADDGVAVPLVVPHCQQTTFKYDVTVVPLLIEPPDLYVNVWFDWNRDGDWDDVPECPDGTVVPEWAVQNQLLQFVTSGTYEMTTPTFMCWHPPGVSAENPIWMRITLSEQQWGLVASPGEAGGDGPPAGYEYGETEDYYFVPTVSGPPEYDFGDAPAGDFAPGYPTLLVHNGARHAIGGPWLGGNDDKPDAEDDGQPDPNALGDDDDGNDDEDGVFIPSLVPGQTHNVLVHVNQGGIVQAWVDFNNDEMWQTTECIHNGFLPNGPHAINVTVPNSAVLGQTFARFRISSAGGLGPGGLANDGEVEDHQVIINKPLPKPSARHLKWSQPPIEIDPRSKTPIYCGWDEPSWAGAQSEPPSWFDCWDCPTQCYGDMDCDGDVDLEDIMACAAVWNTQYGDPGYDPCGDFDRNQRVNITDLMIGVSHWHGTLATEPPCPSSPAVQHWHLVADDFRCLGNMPITSIHWWGSYQGWDSPEPPLVRPISWRIGFWSNVPANPLAKPDHSYPKKLLWEIDASADRVAEQRVGIDRFGQGPFDTCYRYYIQLDPREYFWQRRYVDPDKQDDVLWISITAVYPPAAPDQSHRWGWKTRPWHWMDDAVKFQAEGELKPGFVNDSASDCTPIERPVCGQRQSFDMAFELDTDPNYIKWEQPFTGIRNWRHYEDEQSLARKTTTAVKWRQQPDVNETGVDVDATKAASDTWRPQMLADDFKCEKSGPITHIRLWSSWYKDVLPANYPEHVVFTLSIHADIPADESITDYSMPGKVLWEQKFEPGQFEGIKYAEGLEEGWYVPCAPDVGYKPSADTVCWLYDFAIEPAEAFPQQEGKIYWLAVQAQLTNTPGTEVTRFGWKTSAEHWNDDAVWRTEIMPISRPWEELRYPQEHPWAGKSIDLAFEITTGDEQLDIRRLVADDWPCKRQTPITAAIWWGSYIGYRHRACDCLEMIPPVKPDYFLLSIWTDVRPTNDVPYSHPGEKIWEYKTEDYDEVLVGYDKHPENVDLTHASAFEPVFRYSVRLPREKWFCQEDVNNIYWFSTVAVYEGDDEPPYPWGWTNHDCVAWEPADLVEVLHWKLDQTGGSTANDSSGNGNHGTLFGGPIWQPCDGMICGALDLDGDGDYVKVENPSGLDFAPGSFSASAWINAREVTDGWRTILEYDRGGSNWFGLWLNSEGRFHFRVGSDTKNCNQTLNSDEWYLLTATYDSTTKKMSLYINGQLDASHAHSIGYTAAKVAKLTMGVRGNEDAEYFDGLIDDVRIYSFALSADNVRALAEMGKNDDAVAGHLDTSGAAPVWKWEELYDQTGCSEDMSFILFTEPGCFPCAYSTYNDWLALGKPDCWCEPPYGSGYQCDGDADGTDSGFPFHYRVFIGDLARIVDNWQKKIDDPTLNPCADVDHKDSGFPFHYRVFIKDLATIVENWMKKDKDLPGNCPRPE